MVRARLGGFAGQVSSKHDSRAELRYFVSANSITTIGKPSAALAAKIENDEKSRIAKRKEELGEEKLKELEEIMKKAKEESEVPPPPEMISEFPITDVCGHRLVLTDGLIFQLASLTWVPVETAICNVPGKDIKSDQGALQRHVDKDGVDLPFQAHFSHVKVSTCQHHQLTAVQLCHCICAVRYCQGSSTPEAVRWLFGLEQC